MLLDIDECILLKDNCDSNAKCMNSEGSFTCTCKKGYSGNGVTCKGKIKFVFVRKCKMSTIIL